MSTQAERLEWLEKQEEAKAIEAYLGDASPSVRAFTMHRLLVLSGWRLAEPGLVGGQEFVAWLRIISRPVIYSTVALVALTFFVLTVERAAAMEPGAARIMTVLVPCIAVILLFAGSLLAVNIVNGMMGARRTARVDAIYESLRAGGDVFHHTDRPAELEAAARRLPRTKQLHLKHLLGNRIREVVENDAWLVFSKNKRIDALRFLGWLADPRSLPVLAAAWGDPDADVSNVAAEALANYDDVLAFRALLEGLRKGWIPRPRIAEAMDQAATRLRLRGNLRLVLQMAEDTDEHVRVWAAFLLRRFPGKVAGKRLGIMARDADADVRVTVAESIGHVGEDPPFPVISSLLQDDAWFVRARAAKAAGSFRAGALSGTLVSLLGDEQWWVRQDAAMALEAIGDPAIPELIEALNARDETPKKKAAEILEALGVVESCIAHLHGGRSEAAQARHLLIAIAKTEVVGAIEEAALSSEAPLKRKLINILGQAGSPAAGRALRRLEKVLGPSFVPSIRSALGSTEKITSSSGSQPDDQAVHSPAA